MSEHTPISHLHDQPSGPGVLTLDSRRHGEAHVIVVGGELDMATTPMLEAELGRVEASDASLIMLDLCGLRFIDSCGVHLLYQAAARARSDSDRLRLLRPSPPVMRVFETCGLDALLPLTD